MTNGPRREDSFVVLPLLGKAGGSEGKPLAAMPPMETLQEIGQFLHDNLHQPARLDGAMMSERAKFLIVPPFGSEFEPAAVQERIAQYFEPAQQQTEERAIRLAKSLAEKHSGAIAWSREANPDIGECGPPTILFQNGDVPEME